jgi:hypothetical protein
MFAWRPALEKLILAVLFLPGAAASPSYRNDVGPSQDEFGYSQKIRRHGLAARSNTNPDMIPNPVANPKLGSGYYYRIWASIDVKLVVQTQLILFWLSFQFRFSHLYTGVQCLRAAHVRMTTSAREANTSHLVFTASCRKSKLPQWCWTIARRLWLLAENLKARFGCSQQYEFGYDSESRCESKIRIRVLL